MTLWLLQGSRLGKKKEIINIGLECFQHLQPVITSFRPTRRQSRKTKVKLTECSLCWCASGSKDSLVQVAGFRLWCRISSQFFQYTISGASAYLMRLLPQCNLRLRRIQPSVIMTDCASSWRITVGSGNICLPPKATLILLWWWKKNLSRIFYVGRSSQKPASSAQERVFISAKSI